MRRLQPAHQRDQHENGGWKDVPYGVFWEAVAGRVCRLQSQHCLHRCKGNGIPLFTWLWFSMGIFLLKKIQKQKFKFCKIYQWKKVEKTRPSGGSFSEAIFLYTTSIPYCQKRLEEAKITLEIFLTLNNKNQQEINKRSTEVWLIDWSIGRLIDWSIGRSIGRLIDWLINWSIDWLIDWLIDRLHNFDSVLRKKVGKSQDHIRDIYNVK